MFPRLSIKGETSPKWLRIVEISVGLIILALGVVLWWPGLQFGMFFYAALAIALIILESVCIIRTYAKGTLRSLTVILSVLAITIAFWVLVCTLFFEPAITIAFSVLAAIPFIVPATLASVLAIGLLFAGITSAALGSASGKIVGVFVIFISLVLLTYPLESGIVAFLVTPAVLLFPDFTYPEIPAALVTLSLMILALDPLISGITERAI